MSKAAKAVAISTTLTALATIFVGLRAVSRFGILKRSYADDYLIVVANVLSLALIVCIVARELP